MTPEKEMEEIVEEEVSDSEETVEEKPAAPAEATKVTPAPEAAVPEEEIVEERIYTVPFRRVFWSGSRLRRSNRAVRELRNFVQKHMKPEGLLIEPDVNERIWERGIQKPPRKIRVRVTKNSENLVRVYLAEG
jgi:large subunit ribosomal protein L31e